MPTTKYIWDPVSDNVLMESDENDVTTAVYTHEPGEFGSLISQRRGSTASYYHYDAQGSTRALTDSTETVTPAHHERLRCQWANGRRDQPARQPHDDHLQRRWQHAGAGRCPRQPQ